jgi:hypothetical protein
MLREWIDKTSWNGEDVHVHVVSVRAISIWHVYEMLRVLP